MEVSCSDPFSRDESHLGVWLALMQVFGDACGLTFVFSWEMKAQVPSDQMPSSCEIRGHVHCVVLCVPATHSQFLNDDGFEWKDFYLKVKAQLLQQIRHGTRFETRKAFVCDE